jgi:hypothetical protein
MANFKIKENKQSQGPGKRIADLEGTHILDYKGRKIGFIGLCDEAWL